jgi:hypothetical protein
MHQPTEHAGEETPTRNPIADWAVAVSVNLLLIALWIPLTLKSIFSVRDTASLPTDEWDNELQGAKWTQVALASNTDQIAAALLDVKEAQSSAQRPSDTGRDTDRYLLPRE